MAVRLLKSFLPDRPIPLRILLGPLRGARIVMNPRASLRKVFGLYESELNCWLYDALKRVTCVLDVGANDGYFTFGCAAAFKRLGKTGNVYSFEPQTDCVEMLRRSLLLNDMAGVHLEVIQCLVGRSGSASLDALPETIGRQNTLIKLDVEGAEVDVLEGAQSWISPSNLFVIEVHEESYLEILKAMFLKRGVPLKQINQNPPFWLGRENRAIANWWLVSDFDTSL